MKLRRYLAYVLGSLRRGGLRTFLAVLCIAVGVMAVVGLQLAAIMIDQALTSQVREANGGDVAFDAGQPPLEEVDLAFFDKLKADHLVSSFTAVSSPQGGIRLGAGRQHIDTMLVVDPATYPQLGTLDVVQPKGGDFRSLLSRPGSGLVSKTLADELGAKLGDQVTQVSQRGSFTLTIDGFLSDTATTGGAGGGRTLIASFATIRPQATLPLNYSSVYMTTDKPKDIEAELIKQFPTGQVRTAPELLEQNKQAASLVREMLQVAGLIALLVGGVGIINTMRVLLARRQLEIAMLKTIGYRRRDLYVLFGLEALTLGLLGGIIGAALGTATGAVGKVLFERAFNVHLPLVLDPPTIASGVAVGAVTALVFGILPIVRAASVRPLAVLRDVQSVPTVATGALTAGMLAVVAVMFAVIATVILRDARTAILLVLGAMAFFILLVPGFILVVWLVSKMPVPEKLSVRFLAIVTVAVLLSIGILFVLRPVGITLLLVALCGYGVVLLPRPLKLTTKLSLRALGRQKLRSATTLTALFVGLFCMGLVLVLGQDIQGKIDSLTAGLKYNVFALVASQKSDTLGRAVAGLSGLEAKHVTDIAGTKVTQVAGQPIAAYIASVQDRENQLAGGGTNLTPEQRRFTTLYVANATSNIEGYALSRGDLPSLRLAQPTVAVNRPGIRGSTRAVTTTAPATGYGRLLGRADAGTNNVVVPGLLANPLYGLKPGDVLKVHSDITGTDAEFTIVGFYQDTFDIQNFHFGRMAADEGAVRTFGGPAAFRLFELKIKPDAKGAALRKLESADPNAQVIDPSDFGPIIKNIISNLILLLGAITSLALFAAAVIIANSVALAMLERRREIGIMKSIGYASSVVLAQVLLENAVLGGLAALSAVSLVAVAIGLLSQNFFHTSLDVGTGLSLAVIGGGVVLAVIVSAVVAVAPSRARPLEVLRYE